MIPRGAKPGSDIVGALGTLEGVLKPPGGVRSPLDSGCVLPPPLSPQIPPPAMNCSIARGSTVPVSVVVGVVPEAVGPKSPAPAAPSVLKSRGAITPPSEIETSPGQGAAQPAWALPGSQPASACAYCDCRRSACGRTLGPSSWRHRAG